MIVMGTLTAAFGIKCPGCGTEYETPQGINPTTGNFERMILVEDHRGGCYNCPCGMSFAISKADCRRHNHHFFPDAKEYMEEA
jgi:hypothetical protein